MLGCMADEVSVRKGQHTGGVSSLATEMIGCGRSEIMRSIVEIGTIGPLYLYRKIGAQPCFTPRSPALATLVLVLDVVEVAFRNEY